MIRFVQSGIIFYSHKVSPQICMNLVGVSSEYVSKWVLSEEFGVEFKSLISGMLRQGMHDILLIGTTSVLVVALVNFSVNLYIRIVMYMTYRMNNVNTVSGTVELLASSVIRNTVTLCYLLMSLPQRSLTFTCGIFFLVVFCQ